MLGVDEGIVTSLSKVMPLTPGSFSYPFSRMITFSDICDLLSNACLQSGTLEYDEAMEVGVYDEVFTNQ